MIIYSYQQQKSKLKWNAAPLCGLNSAKDWISMISLFLTIKKSTKIYVIYNQDFIVW